MQGYVKEAADRLRQLVEQFGSTLALLGNPADVAALRVNIGAASRGANSDITSITGMTTALSVAQGGTGSKTAEGARSALGLSSAATATITTSADDMVVGRLLKVGDRGIGVGLSTRSTSSPTSRVYLGGWDFSYVDSGVSGSVDGCMLTMNYGQPVYAVQIFGDWRTNLLKVRSVVNSGAFGEWATLYSTQNTTRAADGTLKAI
ncbi:hypothetical protein [Pseudomonas mosselii]|uniref:hypothetical protein n=1 Tax=Pseudomonas mosselii TaxID=78327 RepID=UPI003F3AD83A